MSTEVTDSRFTLTDEDGDRLTVRPPGEAPHDIFRVEIATHAGTDARVFATTDEMRALRDYLTTVLDAPAGSVMR